MNARRKPPTAAPWPLPLNSAWISPPYALKIGFSQSGSKRGNVSDCRSTIAMEINSSPNAVNSMRQFHRSGRLPGADCRGIGRETLELLDQGGAERQCGTLVHREAVQREVRAPLAGH